MSEIDKRLEELVAAKEANLAGDIIADHAREYLKALIAMSKALEDRDPFFFNDEGDAVCVFCLACSLPDDKGHKRDCPREAALSTVPEVKG